ncbi:hypothetical protein SDC9_138255 [bioreactor metagenome]|uniref:Uncharacterized protein n=1 Tax=bioreactor metagenome TaxID=1076179 RepID=A0A645DPI3_9ZZZZ
MFAKLLAVIFIELTWLVTAVSNVPTSAELTTIRSPTKSGAADLVIALDCIGTRADGVSPLITRPVVLITISPEPAFT